MHDRNRAVAHRIELAQTARLEPRRHRKQIAAGVDPARELGVESDAHRDVLAKHVGEPGEPALELGLAGAEHDQPRAHPRELGNDVGDQVEALLVGHARDDADQGLVGGERQAELGGEPGAAHRLAGEIAARERRGERRIGRRIPRLGVDAVDDADQPLDLPAQEASSTPDSPCIPDGRTARSLRKDQNDAHASPRPHRS